jgi:D-alanyl-D-alanine carboxypeptidase
MYSNFRSRLQQTGLALFCSMGLLSAGYANATPPTLYNNDSGILSIPNAVEHNPDGSTTVYSGDMTYIPRIDSYQLTYLEQQPNFSNKTVVDAGFDPALAKQLDALLDKIVATYHKPGAMIRVERAGKVYRGVRGLARIETKRPLQYNDRWKVASNTKPFVAQVMLQLIQEGKIKLDDFVAPLLPDMMAKLPNKDLITLRHLLQHTSGLANYVGDDAIQCSMIHTPLRAWSIQEMLDISTANLSKQPTALPGAEYHYTNTGILLLGALVEKLTGMSLGEAVYQRVLSPLHLYNTEYMYDPAMAFDYSFGYTDYPPCIDNGTKRDPNAKGDGVLENATYLDPSPAGAAGAIVSTAEDMGKWVKFYTQAKTLDPAVAKEQMTFRPAYTAADGFGFLVDMGLSIMRINDRYLGHTGQINGYESMGLYDPETDTTMLAMMNKYDLLEPFEEEVSAVMIFEIIPILDGTAGTARAERNKRAFLATGRSMRSIIENSGN